MTTDLTSLTTDDFVIIGLDAPDKAAAIRALAERLEASGRVTDLEGYLADVARREEQMATGLPGGIGIPHARSAHVVAPSVAVATSTAGVDFGAEDGPATLIFLIAAPDGADDAHLRIIAALARRLMHEEFRDALRAATTEAEIAAVITKEVQA